jgi:GTP-binding protein Era
MSEVFHSGFVALAGRSNAGKSTLLNALVGEKVAIVSDRPQTTRNIIRGVLTGEGFQMVFVDTPGLHLPRTRLGEYMVRSAKAALEGVDAVLAVFDVSEPEGAGDRAVLDAVKETGVPVIAILNKIDKIDKAKLLPRMVELGKVDFIKEIIPLSAKTGDGVDVLRKVLLRLLPEGPMYFEADEYTDQPEFRVAAEIIREKAINILRDEIPHGIGVEVLRMQKDEDGKLEITVNVYCEKASHKAILIGRQGATLKLIGTQARRELQGILGAGIHLDLWVKVREGWRDSPAAMRDMGYDSRDME